MPPLSKIDETTLAKFACAYSGVAWGVFWLPLRALDEAGLVGAWATVVFYVIPLILVSPVVVWRWRRIVAGGLGLQVTGICTALALVLYADAVLYTEVVPAILLFYLTPVWSTLLARFFLGEPVTPMRWLTLALGMGGMYVMLAGDGGIPWPSNIGDWMGLAAGFMWAVCATRMRLDKTNEAPEFTVCCFFWGCVVALAIALSPLEGPALAPSWSTIQAVLPWLIPVLIAVVMTGAFA
ncbi:MAG: DMT family transporter, partial [Pseudomonadota bacterium]